jgi:hypothetical protein
MVFQQPHLRERLLRGLKDIATEDPGWKKYIPRHFILDGPFHYNERAIEFYQEHMNRVYDKQHCLVPTDICSTLYKDGFLVCYPSLSSLLF